MKQFMLSNSARAVAAPHDPNIDDWYALCCSAQFAVERILNQLGLPLAGRKFRLRISEEDFEGSQIQLECDDVICTSLGYESLVYDIVKPDAGVSCLRLCRSAVCGIWGDVPRKLFVSAEVDGFAIHRYVKAVYSVGNGLAGPSAYLAGGEGLRPMALPPRVVSHFRHWLPRRNTEFHVHISNYVSDCIFRSYGRAVMLHYRATESEACDQAVYFNRRLGYIHLCRAGLSQLFTVPPALLFASIVTEAQYI